jgi:immune inhibitor A
MKKGVLILLATTIVFFTACNKQEVELVDVDLPENTTQTAQMAKHAENNLETLRAAFTIDNEHATVNESEDLRLTNKSVNAVSYEWDFGNGDTSTEATPGYQYKMHGHYTITLTVTDNRGNIKQTSQNISVLCIFGGGSHDE